MAAPWERYAQQQPTLQQIVPPNPAVQQQRDLNNSGQALSNIHTQQQIAAQPLQNDNTATNIAQGRQSLQFGPAKQADDLIKSFSADPVVNAYREVLPQSIQAMNAGHNGAGDISVLYAWAKAMDPSGSVREGDTDLAQSGASPMQRAQLMVSQYHLEQGGVLPPKVRFGLIEEMRNKGRQLNLQYSDKYKQYRTLLKNSGLDPNLLGPHEGDKFAAAEEQYVRSVNGNKMGPLDPSYVAYQGGKPFDPNGTGDIGFNQPRKDIPGLSPQQRAAYDAFTAANPHATADQIKAFFSAIHFDVQNADDVAKAASEGLGFQPASSAILKPDISDVRGSDNTGDAFNAGVRGILDVPTMGALDKFVALGDTVAKGGTFDQNLARQYAISDFDQQNHPIARFGGQALGGALLPMGEVGSLGNLALKGAGYGAAYGLGSSRSLSDVPGNVALGGAAGAAVPAIMGVGGKFLGAGVNSIRGNPKPVPPLVDPVTNALNQPLEAMSPAQRVASARQFGIDLPADAAGGRTAAQIGKGLDILPASAGIMEDARRGTEQQVANAVDTLAGKFGQSRTLNEAGAEMQRGALARNDRAATLIGKAYEAIPIAGNAPASKSATLATLQQLTGRFQSNPDLAATLKDPALNGYLTALQNGNISWKDLKDFRSIIGEKIGQMRFGESSSTSDLRALYAGLSEDMRNTAAATSPKAIAAFERANTLNRQNEELIQGALTRILGKDGTLPPEKAAAAVQAMTKGGKSTGDLRTLAQIKSATVKSGAWDEIAATMIRLGGQPAGSQGRDFSPQTFVQWYGDMSEQARNLLFKPELRKSLDQFIAVNQRLAKVNALRNTSNTAPGIMAASSVAAATAPVAPLMMGHPVAAAGMLVGEAAAAAGNAVAAKVWTSPKFVQWMTGYSKAAASGNPSAVKSQIGRLQRLAVTNPELRAGIEAILKRVANDNGAIGVAASDGNSEDRQ